MELLRPRPVHQMSSLWLALPACLALSACSTPHSNTAMELIQHQQEQQAMMHTAEVQEARKNMPSEAQRMLNVVRDARNGERYFAVLAYARKYIADHGHSPELDALYAEALMKTGQTEQSRELYETLLRTSLAAEAHHGLGLLAARANRKTDAIRELSKAVAVEPANAIYLGDLGYARLLAGELEGAGLALGQAAELAPNDNRILGNMAILLLLRNQAANADALMEKAAFSDQTRERVYAMAADLRRQLVISRPADDPDRLPIGAAEQRAAEGAAVYPNVAAVADTDGVSADRSAFPIAGLEHERLIR